MLDVNIICKEWDIGLTIDITLNIRFRTSSTRTSRVRMLVPSVVRKKGSTLPNSSRGPGLGSMYDLKRTYQKPVKLKASSDVDYLADPSMIKKSVETEKEYNTITDDTPNGESSSEDPLKQLYWLGTATVTPLIEKGLGLLCP